MKWNPGYYNKYGEFIPYNKTYYCNYNKIIHGNESLYLECKHCNP